MIKTWNESQHPVVSIQSPIQSWKCLFALLSSALYLLDGKNLIQKPESEEGVQCMVIRLPGKRSCFGSPQTDLVKYSWGKEISFQNCPPLVWPSVSTQSFGQKYKLQTGNCPIARLAAEYALMLYSLMRIWCQSSLLGIKHCIVFSLPVSVGL